jgi:8-oxo-dGTP pyrophosphatase MutT (NUDIX family)
LGFARPAHCPLSRSQGRLS